MGRTRQRLFLIAVLAGILIHLGILLGLFARPEQVTWTQTVMATSPGFASGRPGIGALNMRRSCAAWERAT